MALNTSCSRLMSLRFKELIVVTSVQVALWSHPWMSLTANMAAILFIRTTVAPRWFIRQTS